MTLCQSIDTLSMAYLDDELAGEERRELELHLIECATCRGQVDSERTDLELVRTALIAPPAPDLLKAKLARALDAAEAAEVAETVQRDRQRWTRWVLPGGSMAAAAAALIVFASVHPSTDISPTTQEAVRQQQHQPPLEVQGASTGPWMREHFAPVQVPRFTEPGVQLVGGRLTALAGHDAALLVYDVTAGGARFRLDSFVVRDVHGDELTGGQAVEVAGRTLHVVDADGVPAVTFVDTHDGGRTGYVFVCDRLSIDELVDVVVSSDLIGRGAEPAAGLLSK